MSEQAGAFDDLPHTVMAHTGKRPLNSKTLDHLVLKLGKGREFTDYKEARKIAEEVLDFNTKDPSVGHQLRKWTTVIIFKAAYPGGASTQEVREILTRRKDDV